MDVYVRCVVVVFVCAVSLAFSDYWSGRPVPPQAGAEPIKTVAVSVVALSPR